MIIKTDYASTQNCVAEVIAWLSQCHKAIQEGRLVQANPFYDRNPLLTPAVVGTVLVEIEEMFAAEMRKFPEYHRTAQGLTPTQRMVAPRFRRLPYDQQLAVVQGIDRVFQKYRVPEGKEAQPVEDEPIAY